MKSIESAKSKWKNSNRREKEVRKCHEKGTYIHILICNRGRERGKLGVKASILCKVGR